MDSDDLSEGEKLNKRLNDFEQNFLKSDPMPFKKISYQGNSFLRIGTEFVSGVIAGVIIGLAIDHFFASAPWGLIFFFFLGSCAGFFNIYRICRKLER